MRKNILEFYRLVKRMKPSRPTKRTVEFYENRRKTKTKRMKWIPGVKEAANKTQADITDRKTFRQKVFD